MRRGTGYSPGHRALPARARPPAARSAQRKEHGTARPSRRGKEAGRIRGRALTGGKPMTASNRHDGSGDDAAHLRGLLPDAPEWDLTPTRHLHHRNVLLREIDREQTAAPTPATPALQR